MDPVRVRFAPSPTGSLHVGGARTAIYNWLYAHRSGGSFVLRIEDTDGDRLKEGAYDAILGGLRWLGADWDEGPDVGGTHGPYRQSDRLDLYRARAQELAERGFAYACYCTPQELEEGRQRARAEHRPPGYDGRCRTLGPSERQALEAEGRKAALRLDIAKVWGAEQAIVVSDVIRGEVSFDATSVDDFVILKSNGSAAYNFAVTVDDAEMAITHVIRADEHLSNTPKQILVARALGIEPPVFAHISMVLAPDRSKLSKRHGATGVEEFRAQGYLPEALANYLVLLGWSFPDEREFFSLPEAAMVFDLDRVSRSAAVYDVKKLTWMNAQYLRQLAPDDLLERVRPFLAGLGLGDGARARLSDDRFVSDACLLVRERVQTLRELADSVRYFFEDPDPGSFDRKGVEKHFGDAAAETRLLACAEAFAATDFSIEALEHALDAHPAVREAGARAPFIHSARLAVTGRTVGPGLFELLHALGKETTVRRLRASAAAVRDGRFESEKAAARSS